MATGKPQKILTKEWTIRVEARRMAYEIAYKQLVSGILSHIRRGFPGSPTARGGGVTIRVGKESIKVRWPGFSKSYRAKKPETVRGTFWKYKGGLGRQIPSVNASVIKQKIKVAPAKGLEKRGSSVMFRAGAELRFSTLPFPLNDLVRTPFLTGEAPGYDFGGSAVGSGKLNLLLMLELGSEDRSSRSGTPNPLPARPFIVELSAKLGRTLGAKAF
jgi:hypothetical protein